MRCIQQNQCSFKFPRAFFPGIREAVLKTHQSAVPSLRSAWNRFLCCDGNTQGARNVHFPSRGLGWHCCGKWLRFIQRAVPKSRNTPPIPVLTATCYESTFRHCCIIRLGTTGNFVIILFCSLPYAQLPKMDYSWTHLCTGNPFNFTPLKRTSIYF